MTPKKKLNGLTTLLQRFYWVLMILVIVGGMVYSVAADRTVVATARIALPKIPLIEQKLNKEILDRQDGDHRIEDQLQKIDGKLDRLIEKLLD